ncbi:MAG: DUF2848 domain-containing protein [Planctomycetales bacterium]
MTISLNGIGVERTEAIDAEIRDLVIAGWTSRDREALEAHIAELERLGVARPKRVPTFYRVAASLLTTAAKIQVLGGDSSGEAEPVVLRLGDRTWLGVGSDHTDRALERQGVALAKQLCTKPIGRDLWSLDDVLDHWDRLTLRSFAVDGARREPYQEGTLASMRTPDELVRLYAGGDELGPGTAMFCGTLAVRGEIRPAESFEIELEDPVLRRTLRHAYRVRDLPVEE